MDNERIKEPIRKWKAVMAFTLGLDPDDDVAFEDTLFPYSLSNCKEVLVDYMVRKVCAQRGEELAPGLLNLGDFHPQTVDIQQQNLAYCPMLWLAIYLKIKESNPAAVPQRDLMVSISVTMKEVLSECVESAQITLNKTTADIGRRKGFEESLAHIVHTVSVILPQVWSVNIIKPVVPWILALSVQVPFGSPDPGRAMMRYGVCIMASIPPITGKDARFGLREAGCLWNRNWICASRVAGRPVPLYHYPTMIAAECEEILQAAHGAPPEARVRMAEGLMAEGAPPLLVGMVASGEAPSETVTGMDRVILDAFRGVEHSLTVGRRPIDECALEFLTHVVDAAVIDQCRMIAGDTTRDVVLRACESFGRMAEVETCLLNPDVERIASRIAERIAAWRDNKYSAWRTALTDCYCAAGASGSEMPGFEAVAKDVAVEVLTRGHEVPMPRAWPVMTQRCRDSFLNARAPTGTADGSSALTDRLGKKVLARINKDNHTEYVTLSSVNDMVSHMTACEPTPVPYSDSSPLGPQVIFRASGGLISPAEAVARGVGALPPRTVGTMADLLSTTNPTPLRSIEDSELVLPQCKYTTSVYTRERGSVTRRDEVEAYTRLQYIGPFDILGHTELVEERETEAVMFAAYSEAMRRSVEPEVLLISLVESCCRYLVCKVRTETKRLCLLSGHRDWRCPIAGASYDLLVGVGAFERFAALDMPAISEVLNEEIFAVELTCSLLTGSSEHELRCKRLAEQGMACVLVGRQTDTATSAISSRLTALSLFDEFTRFMMSAVGARPSLVDADKFTEGGYFTARTLIESAVSVCRDFLTEMSDGGYRGERDMDEEPTNFQRHRPIPLPDEMFTAAFTDSFSLSCNRILADSVQGPLVPLNEKIRAKARSAICNSAQGLLTHEACERRGIPITFVGYPEVAYDRISRIMLDPITGLLRPTSAFPKLVPARTIRSEITWPRSDIESLKAVTLVHTPKTILTTLPPQSRSGPHGSISDATMSPLRFALSPLLRKAAELYFEPPAKLVGKIKEALKGKKAVQHMAGVYYINPRSDANKEFIEAISSMKLNEEKRARAAKYGASMGPGERVLPLAIDHYSPATREKMWALRHRTALAWMRMREEWSTSHPDMTPPDAPPIRSVMSPADSRVAAKLRQPYNEAISLCEKFFLGTSSFLSSLQVFALAVATSATKRNQLVVIEQGGVTTAIYAPETKTGPTKSVFYAEHVKYTYAEWEVVHDLLCPNPDCGGSSLCDLKGTRYHVTRGADVVVQTEMHRSINHSCSVVMMGHQIAYPYITELYNTLDVIDVRSNRDADSKFELFVQDFLPVFCDSLQNNEKTYDKIRNSAKFFDNMVRALNGEPERVVSKLVKEGPISRWGPAMEIQYLMRHIESMNTLPEKVALCMYSSRFAHNSPSAGMAVARMKQLATKLMSNLQRGHDLTHANEYACEFRARQQVIEELCRSGGPAYTENMEPEMAAEVHARPADRHDIINKCILNNGVMTDCEFVAACVSWRTQKGLEQLGQTPSDIGESIRRKLSLPFLTLTSSSGAIKPHAIVASNKYLKEHVGSILQPPVPVANFTDEAECYKRRMATSHARSTWTTRSVSGRPVENNIGLDGGHIPRTLCNASRLAEIESVPQIDGSYYSKDLSPAQQTTHLGYLARVVDESMASMVTPMIMAMADKLQSGGARELYVLNPSSLVVYFCLETIASVVNASMQEDGEITLLTQDQKTQFLRKHLAERMSRGRDEVTDDSGLYTITMDASKWSSEYPNALVLATDEAMLSCMPDWVGGIMRGCRDLYCTRYIAASSSVLGCEVWKAAMCPPEATLMMTSTQRKLIPLTKAFGQGLNSRCSSIPHTACVVTACEFLQRWGAHIGMSILTRPMACTNSDDMMLMYRSTPQHYELACVAACVAKALCGIKNNWGKTYIDAAKPLNKSKYPTKVLKSNTAALIYSLQEKHHYLMWNHFKTDRTIAMLTHMSEVESGIETVSAPIASSYTEFCGLPFCGAHYCVSPLAGFPNMGVYSPAGVPSSIVNILSQGAGVVRNGGDSLQRALQVQCMLASLNPVSDAMQKRLLQVVEQALETHGSIRNSNDYDFLLRTKEQQVGPPNYWMGTSRILPLIYTLMPPSALIADDLLAYVDGSKTEINAYLAGMSTGSALRELAASDEEVSPLKPNSCPIKVSLSPQITDMIKALPGAQFRSANALLRMAELHTAQSKLAEAASGLKGRAQPHSCNPATLRHAVQRGLIESNKGELISLFQAYSQNVRNVSKEALVQRARDCMTILSMSQSVLSMRDSNDLVLTPSGSTILVAKIPIEERLVGQSMLKKIAVAFLSVMQMSGGDVRPVDVDTQWGRLQSTDPIWSFVFREMRNIPVMLRMLTALSTPEMRRIYVTAAGRGIPWQAAICQYNRVPVLDDANVYYAPSVVRLLNRSVGASRLTQVEDFLYTMYLLSEIVDPRYWGVRPFTKGEVYRAFVSSRRDKESRTWLPTVSLCSGASASHIRSRLSSLFPALKVSVSASTVELTDDGEVDERPVHVIYQKRPSGWETLDVRMRGVVTKSLSASSADMMTHRFVINDLGNLEWSQPHDSTIEMPRRHLLSWTPPLKSVDLITELKPWLAHGVSSRVSQWYDARCAGDWAEGIDIRLINPDLTLRMRNTQRFFAEIAVYTVGREYVTPETILSAFLQDLIHGIPAPRNTSSPPPIAATSLSDAAFDRDEVSHEYNHPVLELEIPEGQAAPPLGARLEDLSLSLEGGTKVRISFTDRWAKPDILGLLLASWLRAPWNSYNSLLVHI